MDEQHRARLEWRGITPGQECEPCEGSGIKVYPSTATWRGGIGGAAMTKDVCNHCWGSGVRDKPWPNWRFIPGC